MNDWTALKVNNLQIEQSFNKGVIPIGGSAADGTHDILVFGGSRGKERTIALFKTDLHDTHSWKYLPDSMPVYDYFYENNYFHVN
jgi:hypothetical protein